MRERQTNECEIPFKIVEMVRHRRRRGRFFLLLFFVYSLALLLSLSCSLSFCMSRSKTINDYLCDKYIALHRAMFLT